MSDKKEKKTTEVKQDGSADAIRKTAVQQKSVTTRSLPAAEELKARFKAGSIPLQSDFASLIDMANVGLRATGQAADQSGPSAGMIISKTGELELNIESANLAGNANGTSQIKVNTDNNRLVVKLFNGLIETGEGLAVRTGKYINVDNKGVSVKIEEILPKGMITMFSGDKAPEGWALCDGKNGTPDLRDRFIVGKGEKFTGQSDGESTTSSEKVSGSVSVSETKLTIEQIPAHNHYLYQLGPSINESYALASTGTQVTSNSTTQNTGGGKGHTHNASLSTNSHSHTFEAIPPYYALAFIIKL